MHRRYYSLLAAAAVVMGAAGAFSADKPSRAKLQQPFPYDPACAWGRLSDGKGYRIRCLTRAEAERLAEPAGDSTPAGADKQASTDAFDVALGPVTADTGKLPEAVASLNKGMPKYLACLRDHGGLAAGEAEVHVRFLVRGRGRAEGVSVKKRRGVSQAAAQCIADVVDRRYVGYPDGEMVGATLVVKLSKKDK